MRLSVSDMHMSKVAKIIWLDISDRFSQQARASPAERIFNVNEIYEPIFNLLSAAALLRISRACRSSHRAVTAYIGTAFNIDRRLARFFPSPAGAGCSPGCATEHEHEQEYARARAFRSLQARTGTLVSGSTALQFFMRTVWPASDLDLYVHPRARREVGRWLIDEGYKYKPMEFQDPRFEVEMAECIVRRPNGIYSMPGVLAVLTFVKPLPVQPRPPPTISGVTAEEEVSSIAESASLSGVDSSSVEHALEQEEPRELKVQIIVAKSAPMEVILGFHSST